MERDVWKRIFNGFTDKNLVQLICGINQTLTTKSIIGIKGNSDLNKIKTDQIRLFRNRLETEICKPLNINRTKVFLRKVSEKYFENYEYIISLSEKDIEILWVELLESNNVKANEMILYLMIQNDPIQLNKGIQLQNRVIENEKKEVTNVEIDTPQSEQQDLMLDVEESGKLLKENESLKEEKIKLETENKNLQEQKKEVIKTNRMLKKSIDQTESHKNEVHKALQKLESDLELRKSEIAFRDTKIADLLVELKQSQDVVKDIKKNMAQLTRNMNVIIVEKKLIEDEKEQLIAEQLKAEQLKAEQLKAEQLKAEQLKAEQLKAEQLEAEQLIAEQLKAEQMKKRREITIIDRNMPDGLEGIDTIVINLITPTLLEQTIQTGILDQSDEIWFIKFRLSTPKQNLINEKYGTKVIGFSTYNELKEHSNITKGGI